jgi:hypothetical protein
LSGRRARRPPALAPLAEPPEPGALYAELRTLYAVDPARARRRIAPSVASVCWGAWRAELGPAGASFNDVRRATSDYRREVWLWVAGERTWSQMTEGLAGRIDRRLRAA